MQPFCWSQYPCLQRHRGCASFSMCIAKPPYCNTTILQHHIHKDAKTYCTVPNATTYPRPYIDAINPYCIQNSHIATQYRRHDRVGSYLRPWPEYLITESRSLIELQHRLGDAFSYQHHGINHQAKCFITLFIFKCLPHLVTYNLVFLNFHIHTATSLRQICTHFLCVWMKFCVCDMEYGVLAFRMSCVLFHHLFCQF